MRTTPGETECDDGADAEADPDRPTQRDTVDRGRSEGGTTGDERTRASDGRPSPEPLSRRAVLRCLGGAGAVTGLTADRVRARGVHDHGARARPQVTVGNGLPDGVRPVVVRGGCDATVGDAACGDGTVGLYDQGGRVGAGRHTYQFRLNGVPWSVLGGVYGPAQAALYRGFVDRIPQPPPSAGPDWGPYQLLLHGSRITLDAVEDLAAPVRVVSPDCEVPASCQAGWCEAVDRTVEGLTESSRALQVALAEANGNLAGQVFSVEVPSRAVEPAALTTLGTRLTTAIETEIALVRSRVGAEHADVSLGDRGCGNCPGCVRLPRAHRVRSWELRVFERSAVAASLDEIGEWARHELRTTVHLEPAAVAGSAHLSGMAGGPLGETIGGLLAFVDGITSAAGGLFGDGIPSRRSWMGQPVEATVWQHDGYVATTDDGQFGVINSVHERYDESDLSSKQGLDFGELTISFDDDEYELKLPSIPVTATSRTVGLPTGTVSSSEGFVGYGDEMLRRARSGTADSAGTTEGGDAEASAPRFSLPASSDCGSGLSHGVDIDLDGQGVVPAAYSSIGSVDIPELTVRGSGRVEWELVPREFEDAELRVVSCA